MEGFHIKDISAGQIIMTPAGNDWFLWIFVLIGLLGIGLFILARLRVLTSVPRHLHYVLLGFGLVFSSGGFLFMMSDGPDKITFDREQSSMIIEDRGSDDGRETRISFGDLSGFIVQPKTDLLLSEPSIENHNNESGLYLFRKNGGFFLLSVSADRSSLIRNAEYLSSLTGISFTATDTAHFFQEIQNRNDTVLQKQESGHSQSGTGMAMEWNEYGSSWTLIFLGFVIIGFNVIIFKAPFPSRFRRIIMALFIIAVDTVMLSIFLFNFFGHHRLEVNESVIRYRHYVGTYELSRQEIKTGEVAMVQIGLFPGEPGLLIVSRSGIQILSTLLASYGQKNEPGLSDALSIFSMFRALNREMIQIESRTLSFKTRYETEQVIRNYSR